MAINISFEADGKSTINQVIVSSDIAFDSATITKQSGSYEGCSITVNNDSAPYTITLTCSATTVPATSVYKLDYNVEDGNTVSVLIYVDIYKNLTFKAMSETGDTTDDQSVFKRQYILWNNMSINYILLQKLKDDVAALKALTVLDMATTLAADVAIILNLINKNTELLTQQISNVATDVRNRGMNVVRYH